MALTEKLSAIGNAIREKNGTTDLIPLADMPQAILDIVSGGGGITYTNIVYNEDDTIELTDTDGIVHTMECSYEDGKLVSVKYDRKSVALKYDGDVLVKVGETAVDMANVQTSGVEALDHTVTFMVDGEPYEVVSVKDGNSVNLPTTPVIEAQFFDYWQNENEEIIVFPYTPTTNINLVACFSEIAGLIYEKASVSQSEYPYLLIRYVDNRLSYFFFKYPNTDIVFENEYWWYLCAGSTDTLKSYYTSSVTLSEPSNVQSVVDKILSVNMASNKDLGCVISESTLYANFDLNKYATLDYYRI